MLKKSLFLALGLAAALTVGQARAGTVTIGDLYSTGVDASHALLAPLASDTHYVLTASADSGAPVGSNPVVQGPGFPFPIWHLNTSTAQWVAPLPNQTEPNGEYDYKTTFTIGPGAILSSVLVHLGLSADDQVTGVNLNGTELGLTTAINLSIGSITPFTLTGVLDPFVLGTNTLVVETKNLFHATTGLFVDASGTYSTVIPEPASMALLGIGLSGLFTFRRFFKRTSVA